MCKTLHRGWYQIGFERELRETLTPITIGSLPLVLVRTRDGFETFDAACPHRGAHLAYGGRLHEDVIVCPFHGHHIGLGESSNCAYKVRGYQTLTVGGLVLVLLDDRHENGFRTLMEDLNRTHFFVQGFSLNANAPAELVVENGFDPAHFECVHGLKTRPNLKLLPSTHGEMNVEGTFQASAFASDWHNGSDAATSAQIGFLARVFSPHVCVSRLGEGESEYIVISGATPNDNGGCTIRVSVAVPAGPDGKPPSQQAIRSLLRDSKVAYEQDLVIWEHRIHNAPSRFDADDGLIAAFHKFCKQFLEAGRNETSPTHQLR